jgi:hypothetical protein
MAKMSRRPRLLYVMHVDWNWIKQRPQYLAEALDNDHFEVLVLYVPAGRRTRLRSNPTRIRRLPLPLVPLRRYGLVRALNRILGPITLGLVQIAFRPDQVLLTSPELVDVLPRWPDTPVHYDCMDLAEGFAANEPHGGWIRQSEARLVKRSGSMSASSEQLRNHLVSLGAPPQAVRVVRNGVAEADALPTRGPRDGYGVDIGYVGTISHWFDFELLEYACQVNPGVRWHLWGPNTVPVPTCPRIVHHGVLPRHELPPALAFLDGFVMPFRLGPLIRAVDPVKIYEYLLWGRPAIAVYYAELEQFRPLVSFYRNADELLQWINWLEAGGGAPNRQAVDDFLSSATWGARSGELARAMVQARP